MGTFRCRAAILLLCALPSGARDPDWTKTQPEIVEHFSNLIRIDTQDPPGNETLAVNYLKTVLDREAIPYQVFALEPNRANLVARLKGNGSKRPVLVMGHTDVVGVQREKWSVDPFAAIRRNGVIYGRGAEDDKDNLTAGLMLMLLLKRQGMALDRDIIFLAEAGEEGQTRVGIDFMADRHWDEIDAEYALAEGGYIAARDGKIRYVEITTTEKLPRGVRLIAHGAAGHGSRPRPDNAVLRLAATVSKFSAWQPPIRLNNTTRAYFERLASISPPEEAWRYTHIPEKGRAAKIDRYFAANELGNHSILRTSITPTMMKAGFRRNVIPSEAEAYLDVRALPDEDIPRLLAEIRRVIGDPNVDVIPSDEGKRPAAAPSRLDTAMFAALERAQKRLFPGAITLPSMLTGATDMAQLRARGVQAYGFGGIVDEKDGGLGGAHGDDERISEHSLEKMVEFLWYAVLDVAGS